MERGLGKRGVGMDVSVDVEECMVENICGAETVG